MKTRIDFSEIPDELFPLLRSIEHHIHSCGIDTKLLELINTHVSMMNQCAFCIDMHFKEALALEENQQRLYSLPAWRETPYYDAQERACLAWAEYITRPTEQHNEDELFDALLPFFDKQQIANLTLAIVQINSWNRLMKAYGIEAGGYQVGQFNRSN